MPHRLLIGKLPDTAVTPPGMYAVGDIAGLYFVVSWPYRHPRANRAEGTIDTDARVVCTHARSAIRKRVIKRPRQAVGGQGGELTADQP